MLPLRCVALLFVVAAAPAQTTATPATTAPDAPQIVIESVGPDGWRVRLGPTNVGSLLASEPGRALWQPRVLPMLGYWQQLVGDEKVFQQTRDRLLGYGGHIRIGMWLTPGTAGEADSMQTAVVLEGDGKTDLPALAVDVRKLLGLLPGTWGSRDAGDQKFEVCDQGAGLLSAPIVADKCLLLVAAPSEHFDRALFRGRALAATSTGTAPAFTQPALRMSFDLAAIVEANLTATHDDDERAMMKGLGLTSLGQLTLTLGTAGPHLQFEADQAFDSTERGIFATFCSAAPALPSLLRLADDHAGSWHAGHFDLNNLHDVLLKSLAASMHETTEHLRGQMQKELDIDLRDDLLANTNGEIMVRLSPLGDLDRVRDVTWSIAFGLRDEAAFTKSLTTMLPKARPFLSREASSDVDGVELQRYGNMLGYDIWLGVGRGMFLLAGGRDAEEQLTAMLKKAKEVPADDKTVALPKSFAEVQRHLPAGLNAVAVSDFDAVLAMPNDWWLDLVGNFHWGVDVEAPSAEDIATARAVLREHNLGTVRSATGFADQHWRWRLFW